MASPVMMTRCVPWESAFFHASLLTLQSVCSTPDCVLAAASIIQGMNTSADPCDDFYEFANGGWIQSHPIPADRALVGTFTTVQDNNKKILTKIIDSIPDSSKAHTLDAEQDNLRKLKDTYLSCMNTVSSSMAARC